MTTYPDTARSPDAGLVQIGDTWYACYTVDGKRRRKSLEVASISLARMARDRFYASLGGEVARRGRPALPDGVTHHPHPYEVRVAGKHLGYFRTDKEAKEAYGSRKR